MEFIWKRSDLYRRIARQGVTFATLKTDRIGGPNTWTVMCWKDSELSRDKAKSLVTEFLKEEYEATHITFFQPRNCPPNKFVARFVTYAL